MAAEMELWAEEGNFLGSLSLVKGRGLHPAGIPAPNLDVGLTSALNKGLLKQTDLHACEQVTCHISPQQGITVWASEEFGLNLKNLILPERVGLGSSKRGALTLLGGV